MKTKSLLATVILILTMGIFCNAQIKQNTIAISGQVTDFDGNPIDSCLVDLKHSDFSSAYHTYTDRNGCYKLMNVEKGNYMSLYVIRPKEYPRQNAVPPKDMRLEFWAWNVIADRDLVVNPRYQKLELYGTTVSKIPRTNGGYMIYFRPMSLTKALSYEKEVYLNKEKLEKEGNISVTPENLRVKIFADNEPLKINSIQAIEEFGGENETTVTGYIVQVDKPKQTTVEPYIIFRVEAENIEFEEKGENLYFYEVKNYE